MGRSKRILYDGAVYHVIQRGHNKDRLFKKLDDYKAFKSSILKYKDKYLFELYHYCIMSNHLHLLLRIDTGADLPKLMHGITQTYSYYYRRIYKYTGYVYQNRYKSLLIESDNYLLECGRYIERNPIRAGIVKDPSHYYWSSYNYYTKGKPDDIITENPLYKDMGKTTDDRRHNYKERISEERPYENIIDKVMLD